MQTITIDKLAYSLKQVKKVGGPQPIFFLGAGASKSGNIPLAKEIAKDILAKYPDHPSIKELEENERTYPKLMEYLQPDQRNMFLKSYIDEAKINVTHIYLAHLLNEKFVDYILTVNFDNLILRALSLYNRFPATHDMAILKDLTTTAFEKHSVVYLHGQHHGPWLLNTPDEMKKVESTLPKIFNSICNQRPWILIGYSGSDPVFEHIKNLGRFDNGLYWVGYKDNEPFDNVKEFLNSANTNAYYIEGYDSDAFMLKLNESLGLGQPKILDTPFSSLKEMIEGINDIDDEEHFKGVRERLEIAKKYIDKAIKQFEENKPIQIENIPIEQKELNVGKLKKDIINLLISEDYELQKIERIEEKAIELDDDGVNSLLSGLYFNWGNNLGDLAETKEGKEAEELYNQVFDKFQKAVEIKPDDYDALYNWGTYLGKLAETKEGKEAEELYNQAFDKFQKVVEIKPDDHEALYNWGTYLGNLARTKEGKEADELYNQAFDKFQKAIDIKPDKHGSLYNWGIYLGNLAKAKAGKEAEELYNQAFDKYQKAIDIKPDFYRALYNWGTAIGNLAKTKAGKEAEELYNQAFDKYQKAIDIKPDLHRAFNNWGTAIGNLAKTKAGKEAEELYSQAFDKYQKAIDIKPDKHKAFNNWGMYLGNLARTKEGKEAEELYNQAIDKCQKAIEYGASSYILSCIFALKGEKEHALKYLDISLSKNEIDVDFVQKDEDWKAFLKDNDFIKLIKQHVK